MTIARPTTEQRLIAANAALFLAIGVVALIMMTTNPQLPAEPSVEELSSLLEGIKHNTVVVETDAPKFTDFGNKNLFVELIPPTPEPKPTEKPPPPDPSLDQAIKDWKLGGFGPNLVFMSDLKTREEWYMDLDDPTTISKTIRFQNQDMVVKLEPPLDLIQLKVTFSYTGREGKQTVDKFLYSD